MKSERPFQPIFFDHQATTPLDARVLDAMLPHMTANPRNPHSSEHSFGWAAESAVEKSRTQIADAIGAAPDEIIFTSGATEANNLAIRGMAQALPVTRSRILVSAIEHKAVLAAARSTKESFGMEVIVVPVGRDGILDMATFNELLDERVGLVSIMAVNNEIGTIQPIAEVAAACSAAGAHFHCDGVQAAATENIDVASLDVGLLSVSSHKMYGPMGIGALYVRRDLQTTLCPLFHGGGQEEGLRPGTVPTFLCAGFGEACEITTRSRDADSVRISTLRDDFLSLIRESGIKVDLIGHAQLRHPGNLSLRFRGVDASRLIALLQPDIAVSTGSACTSGMPEPSHVLTAIGLNAHDSREVVRFGFGRQNNAEEVFRASTRIIELIKYYCM